MIKSKMQVRNISDAFFKAREKRKLMERESSEKDSLLNSNPDTIITIETETIKEKKVNKPEWMKFHDDIANKFFPKIDHMIDALLKKQNIQLVPTFDEDNKDTDHTKEIDSLTNGIEKAIREGNQIIKKFSLMKVDPLDKGIKQNMVKNLITKLQDIIKKFRQARQKYLDGLKRLSSCISFNTKTAVDIATSTEHPDVLRLDEQQTTTLNTLINSSNEREKDLLHIVKEIADLNQLMIELAMMVDQQAMLFENIETNVTTAHIHVEVAQKEIVVASNHQKTYRKNICCCLIIVLILAGIITLIVISTIYVKKN